jgi:phosphohistidine phosphatase
MVLCSDAARTRETWGLISAVMTAAPQATYSRDLYLAPDLMMLEQIRKASGRVVALIGHNPGIAELADGLVSAPPDHDRFADYPTGATTVMTFDTGRWADLAEGTGQIVDFVVPRDLA